MTKRIHSRSTTLECQVRRFQILKIHCYFGGSIFSDYLEADFVLFGKKSITYALICKQNVSDPKIDNCFLYINFNIFLMEMDHSWLINIKQYNTHLPRGLNLCLFQGYFYPDCSKLCENGTVEWPNTSGFCKCDPCYSGDRCQLECSGNGVCNGTHCNCTSFKGK